MIRVILFLSFFYYLALAEEIPTPTVTPSLINSSAISDETDNESTIISDETGSIVMVPGDPNWVPTEFEMPEEEILADCLYTRGFSFPDLCFNKDNVKIFDIERDSQEVLDKVISKQGKQGKYNRIPEGYREALKEQSDGFEMVDPGTVYSIKPSVETLDD